MELQESDAKSDQRAHARFYKRAVPDKAKSLLEGRQACVVRDYVEIFTPGDKTNIVDRPVRDDDKARFPRQYAAFVNEASQDDASGTLLSAWASLPAERAEVYRFHKVLMVEQLAELSDSGVTAIVGDIGPEVRKDIERAKAFLAATKAAAPVAQMQAELEERDKRIAALEAALNLRPADPAEAKKIEVVSAPKKRGRPSKRSFDPVTGLEVTE